jgi:sec-independent protein translocase protein TatA
MGALKPWHIIVLVVVLILLFGAKRLPDAARSLGRSLRIIKAETKGLVDDNSGDDLAEKAEPQYGRQPLHPTEIQQPGQPTPPPAAAPYVDPVQRTRDH